MTELLRIGGIDEELINHVRTYVRWIKSNRFGIDKILSLGRGVYVGPVTEDTSFRILREGIWSGNDILNSLNLPVLDTDNSSYSSLGPEILGEWRSYLNPEKSDLRMRHRTQHSGHIHVR